MTFLLDTAADARPPFLAGDPRWAEEMLSQLSLEEKIAQLIHVAAWSNRGPAHTEELLELIARYKIGGLIFFQGHPLRQAVLTNQYQAASEVPLMISIDGEWGLGMRLDETMSFPYQMTLGALQEDADIYEMGREIARQCRRIGIHVNFAPTVDINNNPRNPVIGFRSLGQHREQVAARAFAYMKGMQGEGVLAVAKHFPGHGDTDQDSHHTLPTIRSDKAALSHTELFPFSRLFSKGLGAVMVAHLHVPALDPEPGLASTLSRPIVTGLLKEEMGFEGLIFTDAMDMKGVAEAYPPGVVDAKACLAGNDVMLFCKDVPTAIAEIRKAVERGEITEEEITEKCRRVLTAKQWAGLDVYQPVDTANLMESLHMPVADQLLNRLYAGAITLVKNTGNTLPLSPGKTGRIATLAVHIGTEAPGQQEALAHHTLEKGVHKAGESDLTPFQRHLDKALQMDHFELHTATGMDAADQLLAQLAKYDHVVMGIHGIPIKALNQFGIGKSAIALLKHICSSISPITVVFGSPYTLDIFEGISHAEAIVLAYQEAEAAQVAAADVVLGSTTASGRLPVEIQSFF